MIKPFQRRLWSYIKERTAARLFLHTCGSVYPVIGDFVELGVDILNPIQPMAADMDTKRLKQEFGDELVFWGGIDTQRVLPHGSQDDITEEVKRRLTDLAPGGGYIFSPAHNVQLGVSAQNLLHLYDMGRELGRYPLSL
jgi:uroporphyrinogen decarboxylase